MGLPASGDEIDVDVFREAFREEFSWIGDLEGEVVSTDQLLERISVDLAAGEHGQWWRQVLEFEFAADVAANTDCGLEIPLGQVRFLDYGFNVAIASGADACPQSSPFPAR